MAPEQIEHPQDVDHRADIYSLGVVFYQMLTGELPIGRFAPPSRKVQIDVRLDEVVLRALEKEPQLRYQQASEVKTEVQTIVGSPHRERSKRSGLGSHLRPRFVGLRNGRAVVNWPLVNWYSGILFGPTALLWLTFGGDNPIGNVLRILFRLELYFAFGVFFAILWALRMPPSKLPNLDIPEPHRRGAADSAVWQSPDSGWGWLVGKVYGITFTSPLAYRCANLSALGFLGFLYAARLCVARTALVLPLLWTIRPFRADWRRSRDRSRLSIESPLARQIVAAESGNDRNDATNRRGKWESLWPRRQTRRRASNPLARCRRPRSYYDGVDYPRRDRIWPADFS